MSFFDGGNKSLSFGERGDNTWLGKWQGGVILNISEPQTAMSFVDKSKPKTFKDGTEIKKIIVSLDTRSGKCPAAALDEEDDGVRDWHVDKGSGQSRAMAAALRAAKLGDIAVGGSVYLRWVSGVGNVGDPRVFEAVVEPPAQGSGGVFEEPAQPDFPGQVVPAQPATSFPPQVASGPAAQQPRFDPNTGQPINPPPAQQAPAPRFDPMTGQPLAQAQPQQQAGPRFDPNTGQPLGGQAPAQQPVTNPYAQR